MDDAHYVNPNALVPRPPGRNGGATVPLGATEAKELRGHDEGADARHRATLAVLAAWLT